MVTLPASMVGTAYSRPGYRVEYEPTRSGRLRKGSGYFHGRAATLTVGGSCPGVPDGSAAARVVQADPNPPDEAEADAGHDYPAIGINVVAAKRETTTEVVNPGQVIEVAMRFDVPKEPKATAIELHEAATSGGATVRR